MSSSSVPPPASESPHDERSSMYERYAKATNISEEILRRETSTEYWTDTIDMTAEPDKIVLSSFAGCAIVDLRATSLSGTEFAHSFIEDFEDWKESHFHLINRTFRRELINVLAEKGVFPLIGDGNQSEKLAQIAQRQFRISQAAFNAEQGRMTPPYVSQQPTSRQPTIDPVPSIEQGQTLAGPTLTPRTTPLHTQYEPSPHPSYNSQQQQTLYTLPPLRETVPKTVAPEKLVQFQKAWKKENNYTGKPYDILIDKTKIFIELCRRLGIEETQYANVFPGILDGRANMYYIHTIGPGHSWKSLYEQLDRHFNKNVNHNQYWTDWTTISYARSKNDNPDKSPHEALEAMIDKLTLAQRALGPQFQGDVPLHTAVVRACRGQPEFEQAMFSPSPTCEGLFSNLRSALQISIDRQASQYLQPQPDAYYTDRRYNSSRPRTKFNVSPRRLFVRNRFQKSIAKKKCFVCHKEGCWSSNHPRTDRSRAKRQYISSCVDEPSHAEIAAYIADFEGQSEDDASHEGQDDSDQDIDDGDEAIHYLTSAAYLHRTTAEDIYRVEPSVQADQFVLDDR